MCPQIKERQLIGTQTFSTIEDPSFRSYTRPLWSTKIFFMTPLLIDRILAGFAVPIKCSCQRRVGRGSPGHSLGVTCAVTSVSHVLPSATDAYDFKPLRGLIRHFHLSGSTESSDARICTRCVVLHTPSSGIPASSMLYLLLFFSFKRKVRVSSR